jgi:hypothetical protein
MLKILIGLVCFILTTILGRKVPAKNFSSLLKELEQVDQEIKMTIESIEARTLQNQVEQSNQHVTFFTRKINSFLSYEPEQRIDYWKIVQGMNARNKHLDIYNNKFMFTASGKTIRLIDFSGGEVMTKNLQELDSDIKFVSISQESSKRLPKVFILTEKYDIVFYTLKVTRTTARNKLNYDMISRYEFNLMLINPIESWP